MCAKELKGNSTDVCCFVMQQKNRVGFDDGEAGEKANAVRYEQWWSPKW